VSLRFTAEMGGTVKVEADRESVPLSVHLTIGTDSVERIVSDPEHTASPPDKYAARPWAAYGN
jgi:hypothetical protein